MANKKSIKNKKNKQQLRFLCRLAGILFLSSLLLLLSLVPLTVRAEGPVLWDGSAASAFAGGTGTETDPYLISNGKELKFFSNEVNAGTTYQGQYIKLTNDILLNEMNANGTFVSGSPKAFAPIGSESKPFKGNFDGAGREIIGLYINGGSNNRGLFGYALENSVITSCTVYGKILGNQRVGGIVGYTKGKVTGCKSYTTLTGGTYTGGIVGYAAGSGSEISNCVFVGAILANWGENKGGIAGQLDGLVTGCTVDATVTTSTNSNAGGIVGYANTDSIISYSSFSGEVSGNGKVGGIAGYTDGVITICINTGDVNGGSAGSIGGIAGWASDNAHVNNSFNSGAVSGSGGHGFVGGIIGEFSSGGGSIVHHNLNKGTVEGTKQVGSIFGNMPGEGNTWNNYYDDYDGAPGGAGTGVHSSGDIGVEDDEGAVPVGECTWEDIWEKLNEDNEGEDGDPIWNQDMDDEGIPKPGGDGGSTGPQGAFEVQQSVIKEGKHYGVTILEGTDAGVVTVTADSVFTAAFSLKYDEGSNPGEHKLRLKNKISGEPMKFPEGTSVIMLADGSYYYANLAGLAAGVTEITLKNLIKMGSTVQAESAPEYYNPAPVGKDVEKDFLFIFDFSGAAVSDQAESLSYKVELTNSAGDYSGTAPLVNINGKNEYGLSVSSAGGDNTFTFSFTRSGPVVSGYDDKIAGKALAFEFYLEGVNGRTPLPVGTKINQSGDSVSFVSAALPHAILPESFTAPDPLSLVISLDQTDCAVPLAAGNYKLVATAYAYADPLEPLDFLNPRGGSVLAEGGLQEISLTAPVAYAIRASASDRVFDLPDDPADQIAVTFTIQARGSNNVKATLQRKYGKTYVDVAGEKNKSVEPGQGAGNFAGNGSSATLSLPVGTVKGTYRFLFTLYDENGTQERARTVKNIIVK